MTEIQIHNLKGQNSRMVIGNTPQNKHYIYICFLKKKFNSSWENNSKGEGISIRISLENLKRIINVLKDQERSFTLRHKKKNYKIFFGWEGSYFKINIKHCIIKINLANSEKLRKLLLKIYNGENYLAKTDPSFLKLFDENNSHSQKKIYRQGDVLLKQIDSFALDSIKRHTNVVLEGELTGHAHVIENGAIYELLFAQADQFEKLLDGRKVFVETYKNARIVHEEHLPINLEPGLYEMVRKKEYLGIGQRKLEQFVRD